MKPSSGCIFKIPLRYNLKMVSFKPKHVVAMFFSIYILCNIIVLDYIFIYISINQLIYLLTAIGLPPGGSSTVHIYIQTVHRTTQLISLVGRISGIRTHSVQTKTTVLHRPTILILRLDMPTVLSN